MLTLEDFLFNGTFGLIISSSYPLYPRANIHVVNHATESTYVFTVNNHPAWSKTSDEDRKLILLDLLRAQNHNYHLPDFDQELSYTDHFRF